MHAVPLLAGLVASVVLAPAVLQGLQAGGHLRENYRGAALACPFGLLVVLGIVLGAGLADGIALLTGDERALSLGLAFVVGVGFLGLVDDMFTGAARGLRGHGGAVLRGEWSTGAVKAVGTVALALGVAGPLRATGEAEPGEALLIALVLVLATNLFNLFDLRPGRAAKAFVLVAAGCALAIAEGDGLGPLGVLVGPVVVAGVYDLRERAMLGDTGSNAIGAAAGVFLITAIDTTTGLAVCAAVLAAITAYGEFRSISALVERTPVLKHLDSLGRPKHA